MRFLPDQPHGFRPRERRWLGWLLLFACAGTATTTAWPWLRIELLPHFGEAGWHTQTGFTCLLTCVLLALLMAIESSTRTARSVVRPASAFVALVAVAIVAGDVLDGPGALRGIAAHWTGWFWAAVFGMAAVAATCWHRLPGRMAAGSGR